MVVGRAFRLLVLAALMVLAGCGGGDSGSSGPAPVTTAVAWMPGVFAPAATFAGQCDSAVTQNNWLRSWTNDLYLWYDEVVDRDPALSTTPAYFNLLKTTATTPSGNPKDKFHFTYDTAAWIALSQSGVSAGYGAEWAILARTAPRRIVVAYTDPGSPASTANLARGTEVLFIDGVDAVNDNTQAGVNILNAGLSPATTGETHTFVVRDLGASNTRTITMQSANITLTPVQNVRTISSSASPGLVGYLLFTDHVATAESGLVNAMSWLAAANVSDLVLDIRYNGGGYLDIASELAYMIAGSGPTAGRVFERIVMNNKHPSPGAIGFHATSLGFSVASGQILPTLNLSRVFVLTGSGTCSASESIINSLRGVGVQVIQIGSTTCGKPYGFTPQDNCGTTYFSIQLKGVNAVGFGDYTDGFSPSNTSGVIGSPVPGCSVADDFTHALGDPAEGRFAAALGYRANATCPAPSGFGPSLLSGVRADVLPAAGAVDAKPPWRENRLLRP